MGFVGRVQGLGYRVRVRVARPAEGAVHVGKCRAEPPVPARVGVRVQVRGGVRVTAARVTVRGGVRVMVRVEVRVRANP